MKRLLLVITATIVSTTSLAVVADSFRCQLEVMDLKTKEESASNSVFSVSRIPVLIVISSEISKTEAKAFSSTYLETANGTYGVGIQLNYRHAVKLDAHNKPIQSRQKSCISIVTSYCDVDPKGRCSSTAVACADDDRDPFEENSGWTEVPLIYGVPMFNGADLREMSGVVSDENGAPLAQAKVNCSHLGTFE